MSLPGTIFGPHLARLSAWLLAAMTAGPLVALWVQAGIPDPEAWNHVVSLLPRLLLNTLFLLLGVGTGVGLLGISLAGLISFCEFPGRRWLEWALLLPMAVPAYVLGFVTVGLWDFSGPIQTLLREHGGFVNPLPPIRSGGGAALCLSLSLYPYVYLSARASFQTHSSRAYEAARSLGCTPLQAFWRVALPMARPAVGVGVLLALLETLADFGTVATIGYETFTTAIYKAWFGLFSLAAAAKLAVWLTVTAFTLGYLEHRLQQGPQFHFGTRSSAPLVRSRLSPLQTAVALGFALGVLALAFAIPVGQLLVWSLRVWITDLDERFFDYAAHTFTLSAVGSTWIVASALVLALLARFFPFRDLPVAVRIATLGYSLPGAMIAVGVFLPFAWLDQRLLPALPAWLTDGGELALANSLPALLVALHMRFFAVGYGPVESTLKHLSLSLDEASRSLGVTGWRMALGVHLPLLRSGLATGVLMTFVDLAKEMPITLMMRPFGWDTLAVRIYEMTSEGEWERAALPSTVLVLLGLVPVASLIAASQRRDP